VGHRRQKSRACIFLDRAPLLAPARLSAGSGSLLPPGRDGQLGPVIAGLLRDRCLYSTRIEVDEHLLARL
jgi:hypothetical protein